MGITDDVEDEIKVFKSEKIWQATWLIIKVGNLKICIFLDKSYDLSKYGYFFWILFWKNVPL